MFNENSIRLSNFIPLSNTKLEFTEDEGTDVKHLFLEGIAHGFKTNLKFIQIREGATRKAVRRFNAEQKAGRIHQVWIDHAYANFFGSSTPTEKVIGHVNDYGYTKNGARFKMDINPDHPSKIHLAVMRKDIDGISIGADVNHKDLYCSICKAPMYGEDCNHYAGQKLENGDRVIMEVDDYSLDELTITAKQADPDGKINLSELNNEKVDSTITFSLDVYDTDGKIVENGMKLQKDIQGETLKKIKKYDEVDTKMTKQADVDNNKAVEGSNVTLDKFNQLVDAVANIKQSVDNNNTAMANYLQAQEQKENDTLLAQKSDVVNKIMAKSKEFSKEELLTLELSYLEKLEKAIIPVEEKTDSLNQSFGNAILPKEEFSDADKNLKLSRDDVKAWMRLKMGFKTPQAPVHIRSKVRAGLYGDVDQTDDTFLQYLLGKDKE